MPSFLRHPAIALPVEIAIVIGAYLAYNGLRIVVEGGTTQAVENGLRIIALERDLGIFHEAALQHWAEDHAWVDASMRWIYLHAYLPTMGIAGLALWFRDRGLYARYRNTLFLCAAIGLLIFAVFPVAPPRMFPEFGFIDETHVEVTSSVKNDYAAVPSYHFGFTLLAAMAVAHTFGWRAWLCALLAIVPALMLVSIAATANHYFVDAAAGAAVVLPVWWWLVMRGERQALAASQPKPLPA
jgi:hypothetical protein